MERGQQEVAQSVLAIAVDVDDVNKAAKLAQAAGGRASRSSHATPGTKAKSVSASISWTQRLQHNFPEGVVEGVRSRGVHTQRAAERALSEATAGWVRGWSGGGVRRGRMPMTRCGLLPMLLYTLWCCQSK